MKQALKDAAIEMSVPEARAKVAEYLKAVRERHGREDQAILRGYRALAKGHTVIDLPQVIRGGGVHRHNGLPRLAVATSSHDFVHVRRTGEGAVSFLPEAQPHHSRARDIYRLPPGTLPVRARSTVPYLPPSQWQHPWDSTMRAMVPIVPPALRPAHSLDGYATLFEVDKWERAPRAPGDPALLKHIGGDLYAVLATWDLTPLEQSVLNGRTR